MEATKRLHTCQLCEAMCGIEVEVRANEIVSIRGDTLDPFSRGHICPKGAGLEDLHADPDRLKMPHRKVNGSWQEIGWEEAFSYAADSLKGVQNRYGQNSVGVYLGNPKVHNYGTLLFLKPFLKALDSKSVFSATSLDQLAHHVVSFKLFGNQLLMPVPDLERTRFFLMLGANPVVSNGSIMTVPDVKKRLKEIQARGGTLVTVDPRYTETSKIADRHLPIKPGADALLMLSMIHVLFEEQLSSPGHLAELTPGWELLEKDAEPFSPERVAESVGIEAAVIRQLVRDFVDAESGVVYGRMGASVQRFGTLSQYLITMFNILTGNLDRRGGLMFTSPAANPLKAGEKGHFGAHHSSVRNLPDFAGYLPTSCMSEDILTEGPNRIRAMVNFAGNPVLSSPNGRQLEKAFDSLDFSMSIDFYINESNCNADLILPPTMGLERDHFDIALNMLAIRNTAKYVEAAVVPAEDSRHDWEILAELAERLVADAPFAKRIVVSLVKRIGPRAILDFLLRTGEYGGGLNVWKGMSLRRLLRSPHGVDLGPLVSVIQKNLQTEDKKIAISREFFRSDLVRLEKELMETGGRSAPDTLSLIGRRDIRSCNSWLHNSHRLVKGKTVCTAMMHPDDAAQRGIQEGATIEIRSRTGGIQIAVELTRDIRPGVISVPHGWGHHRRGARLRVAEAYAGVSMNDITDEQLIDELSGASVLNGIPVRVVPVVSGDSEVENGFIRAKTQAV